jgi:acyl carrier protein
MMADREEILTGIREHLQGRGVEGEVTLEADLMKDLGMDSLDAVELGLGLEERFGIEMPESDMENLTTVSDVVDLVEKKLVST